MAKAHRFVVLTLVKMLSGQVMELQIGKAYIDDSGRMQIELDVVPQDSAWTIQPESEV